jgi:hypothetical protein
MAVEVSIDVTAPAGTPGSSSQAGRYRLIVPLPGGSPAATTAF